MTTESNENKKIQARLEALLFIYGEPLGIKKLAKFLGVEETEVKEGLNLLEENLKNEERGLMMTQNKDSAQLVTKPEFTELLENIVKREFTEDLTPAALETLAITAYLGPVSRSEIEYIRGVNSSFILRALLMRGLVERETDSKRANAYLYNVSFGALRHLGLSKIDDLPEYQKHKDLAVQLFKEAQKTSEKITSEQASGTL